MAPRKKLIIKLRLPSSKLRLVSPVPEADAGSSPSSSNPEKSAITSPSEAPVVSATATPIPNDPSAAGTPAAASESTPAPGSLQVPGSKKIGKPGPKPGSKRGPQLLENGMPKPRGKPGPKKKLRPEGADPSTAGTPIPHAAGPKLGPKANQGAINAGLRALDRTGKPTRKWTRQPMQLKSFTGTEFAINTWRAPKRPEAPDENKPEGEDTVLLDADADGSESRRMSEVGGGLGDVSMSEVAVA